MVNCDPQMTQMTQITQMTQMIPLHGANFPAAEQRVRWCPTPQSGGLCRGFAEPVAHLGEAGWGDNEHFDHLT